MNDKTIIFLVSIIIVVIISSGIFLGYILPRLTFCEEGIGFVGKESDFYVPSVTGNNISVYKNSCIKINLTKVAEDPEALIGKKVIVTGQIYKKEEYEDFSKIRTYIVLKIPKLSTTPYILASYTGVIPFQKGDNITVYGEYSYPAVDNSLEGMKEVGLPDIKARYIEKASNNI